jgi:hypothetical protein
MEEIMIVTFQVTWVMYQDVTQLEEHESKLRRKSPGKTD